MNLYNKSDRSSLPDYIRKLEKKKQDQWIDVWNSVYTTAKESEAADIEAETKAFKMANGVIKKVKTEGRLTEAPIYQEIQVLEAKKGDPYQNHTHIKAKVSEADRKNLNGRVYPKSVWEKNIPLMNANLAKRPGAAFHPALETEIPDVAVRWTNIWLDNNDVMAEGIIIPTRLGLDLDACVRGGVMVGVSSRGYGSVESGVWEGEDSDIIQDDYECETFDTVIKPSSQNAGIYAYEAEVKKKITALTENKQELDTLEYWEFNNILDILFEVKWTTKHKNDLPDSAFALVHTPVKDKAKDRALPYKGPDGKVDLAHVRNALARLPLVKGFSDEEKARAKTKLQNALKSIGGEPGEDKEESMNKTKTPHNHVHVHTDEQGNYMYSHEHPHQHNGESDHDDYDAHMHGHVDHTMAENAEVDALGDDSQFVTQYNSADLGEENDTSATELADEEKEVDPEVAEKAKAKDDDGDADNPDDDKFDPDNDGDDDSTASGDTDHDYVKADGSPGPKAKKKTADKEAITQVGQQIVHALQRGDSTSHGVTNDNGFVVPLENDDDPQPEDSHAKTYNASVKNAKEEDDDDDNMGADNGKVKDSDKDDDPDATKKKNSKPRGESKDVAKLTSQIKVYSESVTKLGGEVTQLTEDLEETKESLKKVERQRDIARSRVSLINKLVETCKAEKFSWATFVHLIENVKTEAQIDDEVKKSRSVIENTLMSIGKSPAGHPILEKEDIEEQTKEEYNSVDYINQQMASRR